MIVVALAQQKGGVMKSTLAVHLAAESIKRKKTAIVFELDRQGTATFWAERRGDKAPAVRRVDSLQLAKELKEAGTDYVFLDLPGAHHPYVSPAIRSADIVLIPARPAEVDIVASGDTLASVQRLGKRYAYVLTFVPPSGDREDEARAALRGADHPVAPRGIGDRKVFIDAMAAGQTVAELEPRGKGAEEVARLWDYVLAQLARKHVKVA